MPRTAPIYVNKRKAAAMKGMATKKAKADAQLAAKVNALKPGHANPRYYYHHVHRSQYWPGLTLVSSFAKDTPLTYDERSAFWRQVGSETGAKVHVGRVDNYKEVEAGPRNMFWLKRAYFMMSWDRWSQEMNYWPPSDEDINDEDD